MASGSDTRHYDVHGALCITVAGANTPAGEVLDAELGHFRSTLSERPDLTLVLGAVPETLSRRVRSLGSDLLYDDDERQLLVFRPGATQTNGAADLKYVVRGDTTTPTDPVCVYVPNLVEPYSRGKTARRAWRGKFSNPADAQVEDLLAGIVEPFLRRRLAHSGGAMLHAAGVVPGAGTILFGPSNVGKTRLALQLVQTGAAFLSDDLVIVDGNGTLRCYPKRIRLPFRDLARHPALVDQLAARMGAVTRTAFQRHARRGTSRTHVADVLCPISDVINDATITDTCALETVVHLERGPGADVVLRETDPDDAAQRLVASTEWQFHTPAWRSRRVLLGFAFAENRNFLSEELLHQERIEQVVGAAFSGVRAFELALPPALDERTLERAVDAIRALA